MQSSTAGHAVPHMCSITTPALLVCVSSQKEVDAVVADLGEAGAMRNTTVVSAPQGCGLGERYAALCSALSMGERVRDQGGHSFVVLDDISCMVRHVPVLVSCVAAYHFVEDSTPVHETQGGN